MVAKALRAIGAALWGRAVGARVVLDLGLGFTTEVELVDGLLPLEVEAAGGRGIGHYVLVAWAIGRPGEVRRAYYEHVRGPAYGGRSALGLSWYGAAIA